MTVDLVKARPDLVFLRRRLKVGEVIASPVSASPARKFTDLSTGSNNIESATEERILIPTKPVVQPDRTKVLTPQEPVVRLNARQSAIGSLVLSGVTEFGWQTMERHSGIVQRPVYAMLGESAKDKWGSEIELSDRYTPTTSRSLRTQNLYDGYNQRINMVRRKDSSGNVISSANEAEPSDQKYEVPSYGRRKLVEFTKEGLIVGLRHIEHIRRVVFASADKISVTLLDGGVINMDSEGGKRVLYMSRINNVLEFRSELLEGTIDETFAILK